jgi:WD40 repeat protein
MPIQLRSLLLAVLVLPGTALAQLPSTDIYVMEVPLEPGVAVDAPLNITDRRGYDNQPRFSHDGRFVYYVSIREDDQSDVYRYDLTSGTTSRVTFSDESEYSPTPRSGGLDVVRVEADGIQRLWHFDEEERSFALVAEDLAPVGYFGWIDKTNVAAFLVGQPHVLVMHDIDSGTVDTLAREIGRTVTKVPGRRAVSYIQQGQAEWSIDMYDMESRGGGTITPALPGREDFAWLPDGRILMADGGTIYVWTSSDGTWSQFADVTDHGISEITRIAVSPTGHLLAFVATR